MPKIIKKKPLKKKSSQEPEVKTAALEALDLMKKKQKQAITIISLIAAIALLLLVFKFYYSSQTQKAHDIELEANNYYYGESPYDTMPDTERWKKALELYQRSVDTKATAPALFNLGNSYFDLGDYENAIKQYNAFSDKFSSNYVILSLVYQKLADAYFKTGKNDMALQTLGNLAKVKNGIFRDTALHLEANYYERTGDPAKAQERYKTIVSEFPTSPWAQEAAAKIGQSSGQEGMITPEPAVPAEGAGTK